VRNFGSAIFPITIASLLAGLSYSLQWYIQAPEELAVGAAPHLPDAIVSNAEIYKIGPDGKVKYRLVSPRILHFRDDDSTQLDTPVLQHFKAEGPPTKIRASIAYINGPGTVAQFNGGVEITRPAFQETAALQGNTASLTVYPEDGKAETASPVTLLRGHSWLKGIGLSVDNSRQLFVLHQNARGFYPPNSSTSTHPSR
jgi:lipopolysaccharide export system protein LptC